MTLRLLIFSNLFTALLASTLLAGDVSGRVELLDSKDAAVRKKRDFSGVVVSLLPATGTPTLEIQPAQVTMLQKDKTFTPHVLAVTTNSSVSFPNADPIFHNAFSNYNGQIFDVGLYPPGTTRVVRFRREGVVRIFCNIHSAMSAVIVVVPTPYFAVTGKDGSFSIPDVLPGDYDLKVFHERASESTLEKLTQRIHVQGPSQSLDPIRISEAGFIAIPHSNKFGNQYLPEPSDSVAYPLRH